MSAHGRSGSRDLPRPAKEPAAQAAPETPTANDAAEFITLRDGRALAYQRFGPRDGRPLYFLHGFPGCRLQAAMVATQAAAAGVCLIAPDRPGFGQSTPAPQRTILDACDDVVRLADTLGHERFGVLGVSCGGPYALACAYRRPSRLDYVGLVAGMGPMDLPSIRQDQHPLLRGMFALARVHPRLVSPLLLLDRALYTSNPERAVRALEGMLTAPDRQALDSYPALRAAFAAGLAEAYRQGIGGALREASLIAGPRGYALQEITVPVHLYQGGEDRNVPPAMAEHMARCIPTAHLHYFPEEGHLSILVNRIEDCLRDFVAAGSA